MRLIVSFLLNFQLNMNQHHIQAPSKLALLSLLCVLTPTKKSVNLQQLNNKHKKIDNDGIHACSRKRYLGSANAKAAFRHNIMATEIMHADNRKKPSSNASIQIAMQYATKVCLLPCPGILARSDTFALWQQETCKSRSFFTNTWHNSLKASWRVPCAQVPLTSLVASHTSQWAPTQLCGAVQQCAL